MGKIWQKLDPTSVTKNFDQITNSINRAVDDQDRALKKAETALKDYQRVVDMGNTAKRFIDSTDAQKTLKEGFGQDFNKFFNEGKNGRIQVKSGQRPAIEEWFRKNLDLDPNIAKELAQNPYDQVSVHFLGTNARYPTGS